MDSSHFNPEWFVGWQDWVPNVGTIDASMQEQMASGDELFLPLYPASTEWHNWAPPMLNQGNDGPDSGRNLSTESYGQQSPHYLESEDFRHVPNVWSPPFTDLTYATDRHELYHPAVHLSPPCSIGHHEAESVLYPGSPTAASQDIEWSPVLSNNSLYGPDNGVMNYAQQTSLIQTQPSQRTDPPQIFHGEGPKLQRQECRFPGDEYAAEWVRGQGTERAGWCGLCSSWHKLKDSAYWYHMHYSHGISCNTGKPFDEPIDWRRLPGSNSCEALCGGCEQWILLGRFDQWRTPYFRHAYKCQIKKKSPVKACRARIKSASPRGAVKGT